LFRPEEIKTSFYAKSAKVLEKVLVLPFDMHGLPFFEAKKAPLFINQAGAFSF
jgi:hypothetical protein